MDRAIQPLSEDREGDGSEEVEEGFPIQKVSDEYRLAFEQAVVGTAHVSLDGACLRANRRLADLLKQRPEDLRGRALLDLIHVDDRGRIRDVLGPMRSGEACDPAREVVRWVCADGTLVPARLTLGPVQDPAGQVVWFTGVVERCAPDAVHGTESETRMLFEATSQGVVRLDAAGRIVSANAAAERILGLPFDELKGRTPLDPRWKAIYPDGSEVPAEKHPVMVALETGMPASGVIGVYHPRREATVWLSVEGIPRTSSGVPTRFGAFAVFEDVTERIRAEEALRESNERFQAAFHASPIAVVITRRDDAVYVDVNQAAQATFGFTRDEVVGRSALAINIWVSPLDRTEILAALSRDGEVNGWEARIRRKDGAELLCLISVRSLMLRGVKHLLFITEDITRRRILEAQVLQSQKLEAVGRLAGGVAHDFNNLLTVILGAAHELQGPNLMPSVARSAAREIQEASERAASLTRQLLAFSRNQRVHPEVLDLNAVVSGLVGMLRRLIGEDLELVVTPSAEECAVRADHGQLEQVLVNLVVNARDAMPEGGRVSIATARVPATTDDHAQLQGPAVLLTVCDTGCGMSPEVQARLFEPFFTTKAVNAGTGLGLATVYGIVSQAGGRVTVESAPGRGSTFQVWLPAVAEKVGAVPSRVATSIVCGNETVLLVEDEATVRALCARALRGAGYRVLEASEGTGALALIQSAEGSAIAALIADVVMPGITGLDLAKQARRLRPALRVLFVSGYTDRGGELPVVEGWWSFVQKPFNAAGLTRALRDLIDRVDP